MKQAIPFLVAVLAAAPSQAQSITVSKGAKRAQSTERLPFGAPFVPSWASFAAPVDYELSGSEPADMEVADLDGDGNLDLCVAGRSDADVSIQWGDGQGDFSEASDFVAVLSPYDPGPWGVTSGDYDEDGLLDVAVTLGGSYNGLGQTNHKVHLFLNDGDRNFVHSTTVLSSGYFPIDCSAADFDEDDHLDLVVVNNSAGIDIFPGLGDGTFGPRRTITGNPPQNLIACRALDLDADGHRDLIATNAGLFAGHTVYWGDGTGWLDSSSSGWLSPGYGLGVGDVNRDGELDIVSSAPTKFPNYTGGLWVVLGTGSRGFVHSGTIGTPFTGTLAVGEVNDDGRLDVFGLDGAGIRTYYGYGDGGFLEGPHLPTGLQPTNLALGDWNADGLDDVASPYRNLGDTPYTTVLMNATR